MISNFNQIKLNQNNVLIRCALVVGQKLYKLTVDLTHKLEKVGIVAQFHFFQKQSSQWSKLKQLFPMKLKTYESTNQYSQQCMNWFLFVFLIQICQTNKELAAKIVDSLKSQCFNSEFDAFQMSNDVSELSIHDELTYGITDTITKVLQALLEKVKCSLKAIQKSLVDSDLLDIFTEFKDDVERVLSTDAKKCLQVEGLSPKIK